MPNKILFIDNDPAFLSIHTRLLQKHGYTVLQAATLQEAIDLLQMEYVHMAICDIRMVDDNDPLDISGLELAQEDHYRPLPKIILTNHADYHYAREALGHTPDADPPAVRFLDKSEGANALLQAVAEVCEQYVQINAQLKIRWNPQKPLSFPHLVTLIEAESLPSNLLARAEELENLFRQLFFRSEQITINRILTRNAHHLSLEMFVYGSSGFNGQLIVACGRRERIREEDRRYQDFAPQTGGIGGVVNPVIHATVKQTRRESLNYAATVYVLVGGGSEEVTTFKKYYQSCEPVQLNSCLDNLYQTTLAGWRQQAGMRQACGDLLPLCRDWFLTPAVEARLTVQIDALAQEALHANLVQIKLMERQMVVTLPGQDAAVYPHPVRDGFEETLQVPETAVCGAIHGHVNAETVLVGPESQTWVLDYTRAGLGPLVVDFVTLETAIKYDLLAMTDIQARTAMEQKLLGLEATTATTHDSQVEKACAAIRAIRNFATATLGVDMNTYYTGLLFAALGKLATYELNVKHTQFELTRFVHCLLSAALLSEKLGARVDAPPDAYTGIWIDTRTQEAVRARKVLVDGQPVHLAEAEYKLLQLLVGRHGQPCSRELISEAVYGTPYERYTMYDMITTTVHRLREKIEPDPSDPRYLQTVRGVGYKLILP